MTAQSEPQRSAIGRTRGLVVYGSGADARGLVITVNARVVEPGEASEDRLLWQGPVTLQARAREHLNSIVLSVVDRVTELLGVPPKHYELSCANPGAASAHDLGVSISGFSADVPMFLALLSAALQIPIMEGLASTGHVASAEGDIGQVRGLPEKIEAALAAGTVSKLIVPDLESDASLRALTRREYERAMSGIRHAQSDIEIAQVSDVAELLRAAFAEEMLAMGSLCSGYFSSQVQVSSSGGPVRRAAAFLREDNAGRLWRAVEAGLLYGDYARSKALLSAYADHHLRREEYPTGFGERLCSLLISVPLQRRREKGFFPLLTMPTCVGLSNLAGEASYPDVRLLYRASFGEDTKVEPRAVPAEALPTAEGEEEAAAPAPTPLDVLLARISPEALAEEVGLPLDEARARYQMDTVVVQDADQFNQQLLSFYAHILRHTHEAVGTLDPDALLGEALDVLERAFDQEGGYRGAVAEALDGTRGGLRFIYDRLTEQLKRDATAKYVHLVFTETIDPLDWEAKVALMSALLERIGSGLPVEVREQPPQRYAAEYETIVRYYVDSLESVSKLLKAL